VSLFDILHIPKQLINVTTFDIKEYISIPVKDKLSCVDEISLMVYINIQRHFWFDLTAFPQKQILTGQKE